MLKLSMKPTGWFHIGWSAEIPPGGVKPLRYFGQDLVAFRTEQGTLAVIDAHCRHLGAHLGYGGKVKKGCVVCPYHGWAWDAEGRNAHIPYQDTPTGAKLSTRSVIERHGLIFLWHDPAGGGPREGWDVPDVFADFPEVPGQEQDYYPCYPLAIVDKPGEPIHPQLIQENAADSMHFRHTHGAPEDPELLWFETPGTRWRSKMGFKSPKTKEVALTLHTLNAGVGLSFATFDGARQHYRLILTATPVDDTTSDLRVSYFLPRDPTSPEVMPAAQRAFARHTIELFEEDARIWRHQIFIQRPVFARQDIAGYTALRRWCQQFYEAPEGKTPLIAVAE
ncbi:MAG: Rieske 2Fe-2S domain-containing protein [Azospirillaceae bacterium]|nr:Rieske 2Fe-2S domain-containing protein [Azospirillaceae bacterium]